MMKNIDKLREYVLTAPSICSTTRAILVGYIDNIECEVADMWHALTIDAKPMTDENMAESGWVRKNKEHVISHATVEVTPHIDWSRMADELDEFVEIVRGMAGDAE